MDVLAGTPWADDLQGMLIQAQRLIKMVWRAGLMTCPDSCAAGVPAEECGCVGDLNAVVDELYDGSVYAALDDLGIFAVLLELDATKDTGFIYHDTDVEEPVTTNLDGTEGIYSLKGLSEDDTELVWFSLLDACMTSAGFGDMFAATSAADPTFWVLHPNMERLWQWSRMNDGYEFEGWPEADEAYFHEGACYGHNEHDLLDFEYGLFGETDLSDRLAGGMPLQYTAGELYHLIDPLKGNLNYVYDHFDWDHCEEVGFPMGVPQPDVTEQLQLSTDSDILDNHAHAVSPFDYVMGAAERETWLNTQKVLSGFMNN
jgi:hypothetical protein